MFRKFTETEIWYLLSDKHHIMPFKKFEVEKTRGFIYYKKTNETKWGFE